MWFQFLQIASIFVAADCVDYDKHAEDVLTRFHSMVDTPLSKDIGKLSRFKEELAEFSKRVLPLAERFAMSLKEGKQNTTPISNMSSDIRDKIIYFTRKQYLQNSSNHLYWYMTRFDKEISIPLKGILFHLQLLGMGTKKMDKIDINMCDRYPGLNEYIKEMEKVVGTKCLNKKFSPETASVLFSLIDSFEFRNYTLNQEEEDRFNELFSDAYLYLQSRMKYLKFHVEHKFLRERKDSKYENRLHLLEDLVNIWSPRYDEDPMDDCLLWSAFIRHHFNSDIMLRIGDVVISNIYALKYVTLMCANISHYGDPEAAGRYVIAADEQLAPVYSVLTDWIEPLLESTWPTTETELISRFMKEATGSKPIPKTASEYQNMVSTIYEKMKSIGHPGYNRHFLLTPKRASFLDFFVPGSQDFEKKCKDNITCSSVVSVGALCVTVRIAKDRTENETIVRNFQHFIDETRSSISTALEKEFNSYWNNFGSSGKTADRLYSNHGIALKTFTSHSSYLGLHASKYKSKCEGLYGLKSEEGDKPKSLQLIHYRNNGSMLSNCHEWLFFLGM